MRYIYFEEHKVYTEDGILLIEEIKNANVLMLRPDNLSSRGDWGFRTVTEQGERKLTIDDEIQDVKTTLVIDQYWLDLDVYDMNSKNFISSEEIQEVIDKLKARTK